MASAKYYREQAQLLPSWSLATTDPEYASLLSARAMELLADARESKESDIGLIDAISEFNETQVCNGVTQHQQQLQPHQDHGE